MDSTLHFLLTPLAKVLKWWWEHRLTPAFSSFRDARLFIYLFTPHLSVWCSLILMLFPWWHNFHRRPEYCPSHCCTCLAFGTFFQETEDGYMNHLMLRLLLSKQLLSLLSYYMFCTVSCSLKETSESNAVKIEAA